MSVSLSVLRERLHRKSHEYFVFESKRRKAAKLRMFYGATDALLDAGHAALSYSRAIASDPGVKLLVCYGFLQALYVQQDAVRTLSLAVGLEDWRPNNDKRLRQIRDTRNRLTGHPAWAGENEKPRRLSSAIIPDHNITQDGFRGHVYYDDGIEHLAVDVRLFLKDNEERLAAQMECIEMKMDEEERHFRNEQAARPFCTYFENGFPYLLQRLHCDLGDVGRVPQAQSHATMIRETINGLRQELEERGFNSTMTSDHIYKIFAGLDLLERRMTKASTLSNTQH